MGVLAECLCGLQDLADVRDAGMGCRSREPDPAYIGLEAKFAKLIIIDSIDNLLHVRIAHWQGDMRS